MPERHFEIRWPDGEEETCYSPSSIISQYLEENKDYPLDEFISLAEDALNQASERVRRKYGYACSSAMDQLIKLKQTSGQFSDHEQPKVLVKKII